MKNMKNMKENKSRKFKVLASVLGIVVGVSSIFAPACTAKSVDDTYINDKGELVIVYTDGTEKNLGVVKGEDGKDGANGLDGKDGANGVDGVDGKDGKDGVNGTDGKDGIDGVDGKDFTACAHEYGAWQTEIEATCTSIGYDTRTCALCGDIDYRFNEAGEHNYDLQKAVSVMGDCTERWVNVSCKNCGDTALQKVSNFHFYDENGVCTECEFQADVIVETNLEAVCPVTGIRIDSRETYLDEFGNEYTLFYNYLQSSNAYQIIGVVGEPVSIRLHESHNGLPITTIYGRYSTAFNPADYGAFNYLASLKSIKLPNTITSIGSYVFNGCTNLKEVNIPQGVTVLSSYTFQNCSSLVEINIPDSVTSIDWAVFMNCTSLAEITISENVTYIESEAFFNTAYVNNYSEEVVYLGDFCIGFNNEPTNVTIKEGTKYLIGYAFYGCTSLKEIIIPESVTFIGDYAFQGCSSLKEITIPKSITAIGNEAFKNCTSLTEVDIPESVTAIGWSAFESCTSLKEIIIPEGVTKIGGYAFLDCKSLTKVTIPESLTEIGTWSFQNCISLTEITIPEGVTYIAPNAFRYCYALTQIKVHRESTELYEELTEDYPNIEVVYYD